MSFYAPCMMVIGRFVDRWSFLPQVAAPIPDPMLPDNFERKGEMCFVSDYLGKFIKEQQVH